MLEKLINTFTEVEPMLLTTELFELKREGQNIRFEMGQHLIVSDALFFTRWVIEDGIAKVGVSYLNKESDEMILSMPKEEDRQTHVEMIGMEEKYIQSNDIVTPYHRNSHIEVIYVYKGELKLKIEGIVEVYPEKTVLMMDKGVLHSEYINDSKCIVLFLGVNDAILRFLLYPLQLNEHSNQFVQLALLNNSEVGSYIQLNLLDRHQGFEFLLESIMKEFSSKDSGYDFVILGLYKRLLTLLLKDESKIQLVQRDEKKQRMFNKVALYINKHHQFVSLSNLSENFNYSEDYFNRLIKEITGTTFTEYLKEVRINKAAQLLIESDDSIADISQQVGYKNKQFFYKVFKDKLSFTPHEYRKRKRF